MAFTSLFSPNYTAVTSTSPVTRHQFSIHPYLPFTSLQCGNKQREFPVASVASTPYQPINVDYLEKEFGGHGVTFEGLDDSCVAKLRLQNGSKATLMLPSGLITSYKPKMWHGGTLELLQTIVSEGEDGSAVVQGGVSLAFNFECDGESSWSPCTWALSNIGGNSQDAIQVELISTDAKDILVKHIIILEEDTLSSELVVSNTKSLPIHLTGSLISHLTVSSPEATYACGLQGSDFFSRPMFMSDFSIVPPDSGPHWSQTGLMGFFSGWDERNQKNADTAKVRQVENEEETENGEEIESYKLLTDEMSRIYTSAPYNVTVLDRGRRNSVAVGRDGLDELYIYSPGSRHEMYGKYSYICVGQSAMLKPVILSPGKVWRGKQLLHNPNL